MAEVKGSISELQEMATKAAKSGVAAPPITTRATIFIPNLFNPETGEFGAEAVVKRLTMAEQKLIIARTQVTLTEEEIADQRRDFTITDINLSELSDLNEDVWMLVLGCEWPSYTYVEAVNRLQADDSADIEGAIIYKIREVNDRIPALATYQEALENLTRFPVELQRMQAAYLAGEETLRKYLEEDAATERYVQKWAMTISAVAFSTLREQARIEADEASEAMLTKMVDFAIKVGVMKNE